MNPLLCMVIGALAGVAGAICLIQVYFDRVIKYYHILFHRDFNFAMFEKNEAKESVREARRMYRNIGFFLVIIGAALFIYGYMVKYAPRGNGSLFSNNVTEGIYKLDNEEGYYVQENSNTYDMVIIVTGNNISVNGNSFESEDEFGEYIKGIDQVTKVYIKDDYAVASCFHYVESVLNNNEKTMNYESSAAESE